MEEIPILVCFAVKQEAGGLLKTKSSDPWRTIITGMGKKNAADGVRRALTMIRPRLVITSGFAGGLNPELKWNTIVFDEDAEAGLAPRLVKHNAIPAKFYCAERVVVTAAEKASLWNSTGADAVEMESSVIRNICRDNKIPSATIRVISDSAKQDLPLDFNDLKTPAFQINYLKLAGKLFRNPRKISQLMLFHTNLKFVASDLSLVLLDLVLGGKTDF